MRQIVALIVALGALIALPSAAQPGPSVLPPRPTATTASPAAPAPVAAGRELTRPDLEAWLDGYLPYALQRGDIAGAVVVVVKDGQVLLEKGYGYADVAKRTPVDPQKTLFRPGSVSKLFTWTAVMQQVEHGRLDLDKDINTYLDFRIPPRDGKPITLRQLMTHTPGFEEAVKGLITDDPANVGLEKTVKRWTPRRVYAPGTTPAYSNYGTALAAYIVQRVSGEPYETYVEQHVFAPLGMQRSTFRQPVPARLKPDVALGYGAASGPAKPFEYVSTSAVGGLSATGDDMGRFMIAHLQEGGPILRPETARMMHTTPYTVLPRLNRMLLGFYEADLNGHRIIAHAGDTQTFHSDLNLFLDDGVGVFISMNSGGKGDAVSAIRGALLEGFADRYFPGPDLRDRPVDAKTAAEHAALIAGQYNNARRSQSSFLSVLGLVGQMKVIANPDGTITVPSMEALNGTPKKWREIAPFVWREVGGKERLAAKVVDGKVVRFSLDSLSPYMVWDRASPWTSSAWLLPALQASLAALAATVLLWPTVALVRRRYGAAFALQGRAAWAYRLVRVAALAVLLALGAWLGVILTVAADTNVLDARMDATFWALQVGGALVFVAAPVVALWNAWTVWRGRRGWFARLWSLVLAAACLTVLWTAFAFKLIAFTVDY